MITIDFDQIEYYDDDINEFVNFPQKTVDFEYSLYALSMWESKWKVPFLSSRFKGADPRLVDFYMCMSTDPTLTNDYITESVANTLSAYIGDMQTATTFSNQNENKSPGSTKVYTSEEIYALMCMNHIPIEFEHRNLNRLLTVLRIISVYSNPPEKMNRHDVMTQNSQLNAQRRAQYKTKG